ncbi:MULTISPECIES: porphobilinogen synthase [Thermus]|uniref:Delta-aminolevulinic acid dehydratase n=2 Tax=Thermus scotoductus TaxID=37636 RepID=A0A0N0IQG1_THESC|nr:MULTISPECIES: porphobilinogen synthase [Thermus]ADW22734.1 delta-aminolevulinic acid dehydratase [Thermus scotoductus SA-01]ETN88155.1 delta-aminolevulinic acid dehydratase [Thermus sp. NMX2.A1]KPD29427.1 delta-aminolevulinic acid dehydratase [Thermus scotoductus]
MERPRRLRSPLLRPLVAEVELSPRHLVLPVFVKEGGEPEEVSSMPGVFRHPLAQLPRLAEEVLKAGLGGMILFGVLPEEEKDSLGHGAYAEEGIVQRAIRLLKREFPELLVMADTCLCEYTDHGHCGVVREGPLGFYVDNDATLELLAKTALSQAQAGADVVAPSAMMDGQVKAIREALDQGGFAHVPILSYAVKYASAFYGPFREAAGSAPQFGDRTGYQMDPKAGLWDAMREASLDDLEGADMLMVKPALPYLDVLYALKGRFSKPLFAYQVSGEYAMLKAAGQRGWLDEKRAVLESLYALRRAGAQGILTYYALEVARWLKEA